MRTTESGFSLAELLIATAVMITISGAVFSMMQRAREAVDAQPDAADVQQRLRVGAVSLQSDLRMAGAGLYGGVDRVALVSFMAPVMPYRWGANPVEGARTDVLTVAYVPFAPAQASILQATVAGALDVSIEMRPDRGARRFEEGMRVLIFEPVGAWNLGVITRVEDPLLHVRLSEPLHPVFSDGRAVIAQLSTHAYYLKSDDATRTYQLMHFDGAETDAPVVDNVIALRFRFWTQPSPGAVELGSELTDGPWRPDEASSIRFDADLQRIRRITVTLRVQVAAAWLRGPASTLFTHAGTGRPSRYVPDQEITFDVSPPNLNFGT